MQNPLLKIENLHVTYTTDESCVYAVNGLDLELFAGETLGLVGETGAGKTTTALSVMQLLPEKIGKVTEGSILLDGVDVLAATDADMRLLRGSTVSMIFQDPMTSLNPTIPVGDQIGEVLLLHKKRISHAELNQGVESILELVGIPAGRKGDYPHQFSGGMKQRIVIAIALACEPKLLLADEPTTALDVTIQAQVLDMMSSLKEKLNTSMLLISRMILAWSRKPVIRLRLCMPGRSSNMARPRIFLTGRSGTPIRTAFSVRSRISPCAPAAFPRSKGSCRTRPPCRKEAPPKTRMGSHLIRCHLVSQQNNGGVAR